MELSDSLRVKIISNLELFIILNYLFYITVSLDSIEKILAKLFVRSSQSCLVGQRRTRWIAKIQQLQTDGSGGSRNTWQKSARNWKNRRVSKTQKNANEFNKLSWNHLLLLTLFSKLEKFANKFVFYILYEFKSSKWAPVVNLKLYFKLFFRKIRLGF